MDFQGGLIVLIIFVSLFAIWLIFYFIPVGKRKKAVAEQTHFHAPMKRRL